MSSLTPLLLVAVSGLSGGPVPMQADDYDQRRRQAIERCTALDPDEYQTGLFFNPAGFRSYYVQSQCWQRIAIEFRDRELCGRVRRRRALFSSSWGYSRGHCLELLEAADLQDRERLRALRAAYEAGPVHLLGVDVEPNGNGRDYDVVPRFSAGFAHGYTLRLRVRRRGEAFVQVLEWGGHLGTPPGNVRLYLPRSDLLAVLPEVEPGVEMELEAELVLNIGAGGVGGWLSDRVLEEEFPRVARRQVLDGRVRF